MTTKVQQIRVWLRNSNADSTLSKLVEDALAEVYKQAFMTGYESGRDAFNITGIEFEKWNKP